MKNKIENKILVCSVCGLHIMADGKEGSCLKCGADFSKFVTLSDEESAKVIESDRTNDIHCKLIELSMEMARLCEEGLEIALDPKCVKIFDYLKDSAWDTKQLCKAEIAGHMKTGKW